jgi:hypothetical protein
LESIAGVWALRAPCGGYRKSLAYEDGRRLSANYWEFDHRYAITADRSWGKTVDVVILSADAMKLELFYAGASRGRSEIAIVTSDREQLRESRGISSAHLTCSGTSRNKINSYLGRMFQQLHADTNGSL